MLRCSSRSFPNAAARWLAVCAECPDALKTARRSQVHARSVHAISTALCDLSDIHRQVRLQASNGANLYMQATPLLCRDWCRSFATSGYPPHDILSMPALSPTMEVGNLVQWRVNEGDEVEAGSILADIETDKATLGFETQDDGFIAKLIVGNGTSDIPVGVPIAVLVDSQDAIKAFSDYSVSASMAEEKAVPASAGQEGVGDPAATAHRNSRIGPAARTALANAGLVEADVIPTGPNGILTKSDVLAAVAAGIKPKMAVEAAPAREQQQSLGTPMPTPDAPDVTSSPSSSVLSENGRLSRGERYTDEPISTMRRVIAQRLLQSKQSLPAIYVTARARLMALSELRAALKTAGIKASVNDFVIKAVAKGLVAVPGACAGWNESKAEVMRFPDVDISVAVATDGGLITPIVKGADWKSVAEIGAAMNDLAGRARGNTLKPEEFMGGSFSISNLGMFGIKEFSAIINPPQACILAIGGPQEECMMQDDRPEMYTYMNVRLSADNRVVDEATAAAFLESFTFHIENPGLLMA
eukprot:jgi/Ulvmu1/4030/UM019_0007.1